MYADWYQPVFECAVREFGDEIYAYYFDLPFEETLEDIVGRICRDIKNKAV